MEQKVIVQSTRSITVEHPLLKVWVYAAQIIIYPFLLIARLLIVRNHLHRNTASHSLKKNVNYVLYANHQSRFDPFIICASLPFNAIKQLLPFRFFVENSYFKGSISKGFLGSMGGFPAHYEEGKSYGLDRARALMASTQTIVIFPPGMRTRERIAKPGISVLATEPDTYLIPAHIDWKHRLHCHVHIGTPIKVDVTQAPDQLMQHVYELSSQTSST